ncbi:MAG: hypothetical protein K9W44_12895 [Candidatus Lokiarchaeota archaeon]|nr:hypothetical protein [Candidatus Harpocratesius repetitus]
MSLLEKIDLDNNSSDMALERKAKSANRKNLTIEIAGAAIFSALSIALSYTATFIPRIPGWYIAWFDPVSLIWIAAFLIFGFRAGLITTIIGTIGLIPFDPTIWIGPTMKFLSTIWFIILPYFWFKVHNKTLTHEQLKKPKNYFPPMIIAWLLRTFLMVLLNYLILKYMFSALDFMSLKWLNMEQINGTVAVIVTVVFINTLQTIFDVLIPYFVVYFTPIEKNLHAF